MPSWFCVPVSSRSGAFVGRRLAASARRALEQLAPAVEHADVRPVELVGRARQEVAAERLARRRARAARSARRRRRRARRAACARSATRAHVVDRAERVRRGADRDEPRRGGRAPRRARPSRAGRSRSERDGADRQAALLRERAPRVDVGVVIELGDDDLVARRPAPPERAPQVERERRHVGAEGDLRGAAAQKVGERLPRGLDQGVGLDAGRIGPVRVRVVVEQVVAHRVHHGLRHLRAARAVEVGDGSAFVAALERREAGADRLDAGGRSQCCRHRVGSILIRIRRYSIWPRSPSTPIGPVAGSASAASSTSPLQVARATPSSTVITSSFQSCGS